MQALPATLTDRATLLRAEVLRDEQRPYQQRQLLQQTVRVAGERRSWYVVGFWSQKYGTTDSVQAFAELADAQATYERLF